MWKYLLGSVLAYYILYFVSCALIFSLFPIITEHQLFFEIEYISLLVFIVLYTWFFNYPYPIFIILLVLNTTIKYLLTTHYQSISTNEINGNLSIDQFIKLDSIEKLYQLMLVEGLPILITLILGLVFIYAIEKFTTRRISTKTEFKN